MPRIKMPQSFVGVAGIGKPKDYLNLCRSASAILNNTGRFVMASVLASSQTQLQDLPSNFGKWWYPIGDTISHVVPRTRSPLVRVLVHLDGPLLLAPQKIMSRTHSYASAVQINLLPWEQPAALEAVRNFKRNYPDVAISLQAHREIINNLKPQRFANILKELPIDYVILDASQGEGRPLDPSLIRPFIDVIYQEQLAVGVVVAGGLCAESINELFAPLVQIYPDLSCDAESRLRSGPPGNSILDHGAVRAYLKTWRQAVITPVAFPRQAQTPPVLD